jgi:hypothetical protein
MLRWLRRWRERDDRHLFKAATPLSVDPIDELIRVVNEAQDRDAEDERRLYPRRGDRPSIFQTSAAGSTVTSAILALNRTRKRAAQGRGHGDAIGLVCEVGIIVHEPLEDAHDLFAPKVGRRANDLLTSESARRG